MRRMIVLAAAMSLGGCAMLGMKDRSTTVADSKLVRLPQQDREQILEAQKNVDAAQSNVAAARVAADEANQFCKVTDAELDAAKAKEKAADKAIKLGRSAQSSETYGAGQKTSQEAGQELLAAEAKKQYCKSMVDARQARLKATDAGVATAKADEELLKVRLLQKNNLANGIDQDPYIENKRKADELLARERLDVAQREGEMNAMRASWQQRSNVSDRAQRDINAPPITAPPPPDAAPVRPSPVTPTEPMQPPIAAHPAPDANQ